jgi:hypothetical protein
MGTPTHRLQQDPAEGSGETVNHELERQENRRETGARKLDDRRDEHSATVRTPAHRLQEEPAEGSRETVNHELERQENRRESGARKLDDRRKKLAEASEEAEETTDRPGFDLGGAKDRSGGSATNPKGSVEKGRAATGRASGYSDPSGSRSLGNRGSR